MMIIVLSDEQIDALKNDQLMEVTSSIDIKAGETFGITTEKFIDKWNTINCPYLVPHNLSTLTLVDLSGQH